MEIEIGKITKNDTEISVCWNTEKDFDNQTDECKEFCNLYKEDWSNIIDEEFEYTTNSKRVISQIFKLVSNHLKVTWIYKYPITDPKCGLVDKHLFNLI